MVQEKMVKMMSKLPYPGDGIGSVNHQVCGADRIV